MKLQNVFREVAIKELVAVDLPELGSNQHEINGSSSLKEFFRTDEKIKEAISWHYFDDEGESSSDTGEFTFYDARLKSADRTGRSEWRGYYTGDFLNLAKPGDALILARTIDGRLHGLIFAANSNHLRSALILLDLKAVTERFQILSATALEKTELELTGQLILEELNLPVPLLSKTNDEELMVKTFGKALPDTRTMTEFARSQIEVDINNPDAALIGWIKRETELFYALERVLVQEQLDRGFNSVDHFIEYSIRVQQSRRSRMGLSLQHHLAAVFSANKLEFKAQARTEGKNRPDFLFPGEKEYHNPEFDVAMLVMLGAKSTAKERWRQVLVEADKIGDKHLCTLEPGISVDQTEEMRRKKVQLVIPAQLIDTYSAQQQKTIWNLNEFIDFVRNKQAA
jgi:hypothetical protein